MYDTVSGTWPAELLSMVQSRRDTLTDYLAPTESIPASGVSFQMGAEATNCSNITIVIAADGADTNTSSHCLHAGHHSYHQLATIHLMGHTVEVSELSPSGHSILHRSGFDEDSAEPADMPQPLAVSFEVEY